MSKPESDQPNSLNITGEQRPAVPTYACLIYVAKTDEGKSRRELRTLAGSRLPRRPSEMRY